MVTEDAPRVGFIVSRSVGNSVVRHRVARRLRAACAAMVDGWQNGDQIVVRALPAAASASYRQLGDDLESAYARLSRLKGEGNFA
jgi:ribonuclease P protein component